MKCRLLIRALPSSHTLIWLAAFGAALGNAADAATIEAQLAAESTKSTAPAADPGLSLADAVARAAATSPRVKAADAERAAQVEKRRGSFSDLGPRVKLDYQEAHYNDVQQFQLSPQAPAMVTRPKVPRAGSVTIGQPITGLVALIEKSRFEGAQLELKEMGLALTRAEVAYGAAESWLTAYAVKRQYEIAEQSVAAAESQRRDGQALERAGRMNHGDFLKLDLAVSEAKARLAQAGATRDTVYGALKQAIDLPLDQPLVLADSLPPVPDAIPELPSALSAASGKRLEAKQAQAGVAAADFGKRLAYTNFTPQVNVFWKMDHSFSDPTALAPDRDSRYYGIQATWDIWNNGSHVFAAREAAENVARAEELVRAADQAVRLDVVQALANLRAAKDQLSLAEVAVKQAEEAYRIEQARFRTGSRSATDVILTETSQASARGRLVQARTDLVRWYLKTQKALGELDPKLR